MHFVNLFVYGTLLDQGTREALLGRPMPYMERDTLSGFKLDPLIINDIQYPAVVRSNSSMVHGAVIVIHESELRLLDEYETDSYGRIFVRLMSGRKAYVYAKKEEPQNIELMEEKVLYNVLKQVARKESITAAPDWKYVDALAEIGMIKNGWDRELTPLGVFMLNTLENKINPWGT